MDSMILIDDVRKKLDSAANSLKEEHRNRKWTYTLLFELATLGEERGYGVCPWPETMKGGWLYDLIWYGEDTTNEWPTRMTDVVLVLESEWSPYLCDIRYDFQKLIQAKSKIKVMVCRMLNEEEKTELRKDIEAFAYKDEAETYMIVLYDAKSGLFEYWKYEWQNTDGGWRKI